MNYKQPSNRAPSRAGFTLIELLLSLALVVVATAIIGSLMQLYSRNFTSRGDDIRRQQLARAILQMIADDVRSVVLEQEYDPSVLQQLLGSSAGGGGGAPTTGDASLASAAPPTTSSSTAMASSSMSSPTTMTGAEDLAATVSTAMPLGIYGDQYSLMVDVSRVPRPDEYIPQQASLTDGALTDVPGDLKTVTYYVQTETTQGVSDQMASFTQSQDTAGFASGLVRRQLDRRVAAYAEEVGDTSRLQRTGELVAPEVIAIEFTYFDGVEWLYEWDSSTQALPWLVEISLAMQSSTGSDQAEMAPGTPISTMTYADRQAYGVEVYQLTVAIPGAQLRAAETTTDDAAAGMSSMGL